MRKMMLVAVLFLTAPVFSLDPAQPARVQTTVVDAQNRPLPNVTVKLLRPDGQMEAAAETDTRGVARLQSAAPQGKISWYGQLVIDQAGMAPVSRFVPLFPGAQAEQPVTLERVRETVLRFRTPDGSPVPGVPVNPTIYAKGEALYLPPNRRPVSDERGDAIWRHGALDVFQIGADPIFADAPEVTVVVPYLAALALKPRDLSGRLLHADGRPARGWRVATGVSRFDIDFPPHVNGGATLRWPRGISDRPAPATLPVGDDGTFRLTSVKEDVCAISPQGVAIPFHVKPAFWAEGLHRTTITLPAMRDFSATVLSQDDKPLADVPVYVESIRHQRNIWSADLPSGAGDFVIRTDAQGRFTVSLPVDSSATFGVDRPGDNLSTKKNNSTLFFGSGLGPPPERFVLQPPERLYLSHSEVYAYDPGVPYKDILLEFVGPGGEKLPAPRGWRRFVNSGSRIVYGIMGPDTVDSRGMHLLVPRDATSVGLSLMWQQSFNGNMPTTTYDLPAEDGTLTIRLNAVPPQTDVAVVAPQPRPAAPDLRVPHAALIKVLADGKPAAGAQVFVYADNAPGPAPAGLSEMDRYQWERRSRIVEAMRVVSADLADDNGEVRVLTPPGQEHAVIAYQHGRAMGWTRFLASAPAAEATVSLRPTRRLVVHLPPPADAVVEEGKLLKYQRDDSRRVMVTFSAAPGGPELTPIEQRALKVFYHASQITGTRENTEIVLALQRDGFWGHGLDAVLPDAPTGVVVSFPFLEDRWQLAPTPVVPAARALELVIRP